MAKQWQVSPTIEITGGTDTNNSELITWLQNNATQVVPPTIVNGIAYMKRTVTPDINNITDLTGTTWILNETISSSNTFEYQDISFTSNNTNFNLLVWQNSGEIPLPGVYPGLNYGTAPDMLYEYIYNSSTNEWADETYRTISITGRPDATSTTLINWFKANATLVPIYELVPVKAFQKKEEWEELEITDLTGTAWQFNNVIDQWDSNIYYDIDFTTYNDSYDEVFCDAIEVQTSGALHNIIYWNSGTSITAYQQGDGWRYHYQGISITGGDDVTDNELISWLQQNAVLIGSPRSLNNTKWKFKDSYSIEPHLWYEVQHINFTSNNNNFSVLYISSDINTNAFFLIGYEDSQGNGLIVYDATGHTGLNGWLDDAYKIINISSYTSSTGQFTAWLENNAYYGETSLIPITLCYTAPTISLISFTIGGISYSAVENMTWAEWIDSEYNTNEFYILNDEVWQGATKIQGESVGPTDIITNEYNYSLIHYGGSND